MWSPAAAGAALSHPAAAMHASRDGMLTLSHAHATLRRTHEQGEKQIQQLLEAGMTTFISLQVGLFVMRAQCR